jgi:hypothetical protein
VPDRLGFIWTAAASERRRNGQDARLDNVLDGDDWTGRDGVEQPAPLVLQLNEAENHVQQVMRLVVRHHS